MALDGSHLGPVKSCMVSLARFPLILLGIAWLSVTPCNSRVDAAEGPAKQAARGKRKPAPPDLVRTPLVPADLGQFPEGARRLEIFLLMGQSNMKGRGRMPAEPLSDPRLVMMHRRTDGYFRARHPLHLTGDPGDFAGADNAGVGPGLAFAQAMVEARPDRRVLLIPCAVGGTAMAKWRKGQRLYSETVRRAKLALSQAPKGRARIAGALWLQGESDSTTPEKIAAYQESLDGMIRNLRADLGVPDLPFIACTIGEMKQGQAGDRRAINEILLGLSSRVSRSACVDGRAFAKSIGDEVHFDTDTQNEHGRLFAKEYLRLSDPE